ncbi:MAG: CT583 family protein [Parachlamydiaceae bacterium]|nr:CT583 family protein [Parachlamydiaceae bacterium]
MADLTTILNQRIKKSEHTSKMSAMAQQSATGNLSSFAGVFGVAELNQKERDSIELILKEYADKDQDIENDLRQLLSITSEVKAINNQAALLHGERIKKAHTILIQYRDGAFTAWLMNAYGNRQTPYNLMQYYEFHESIPKDLRPQLEAMPRQAIYTLASRTGSLVKKQEIVKKYNGETKAEILHLIRQLFPLDQDDKRKQKVGETIIQSLHKIYKNLQDAQLSTSEKKRIRALLQDLQQLV